jgi:hypothetical protein
MVTVEVGAMNPPRYASSGSRAAHRGVRVMLDGGPGAEFRGPLDAWPLTDDHAELGRGNSGRWPRPWLVQPRPVVHTSHPTFGSEVQTAGAKAGLGTRVLGVPVLGRMRPT